MEICYFLQFLFFVDVLCSFLPKSLKSLGASCTLGHHILPYCRTRRASVLIMVTWCRTGGVGWTGLTCSNWLRIRGQYHCGWGSPYRRSPHILTMRCIGWVPWPPLSMDSTWIIRWGTQQAAIEIVDFPCPTWRLPQLHDCVNSKVFSRNNWSGKNWKRLMPKTCPPGVYTRERIHSHRLGWAYNLSKIGTATTDIRTTSIIWSNDSPPLVASLHRLKGLCPACWCCVGFCWLGHPRPGGWDGDLAGCFKWFHWETIKSLVRYVLTKGNHDCRWGSSAARPFLYHFSNLKGRSTWEGWKLVFLKRENCPLSGSLCSFYSQQSKLGVICRVYTPEIYGT